jgi:TP901 family phage tail tape measure protein
MASKFLQLALIMSMVDKASLPLKTMTKSAGAVTSATDKAARAVQNLESVSEKWMRRSKNLMMWGAGFEAFGSSIIDKFKGPIDSFARLENGMSSLKVAMMDSTGAVSDNFKALSNLAVDLSNKLPTTAEEMHKVAAAGIAMGMSADSMINGGLKAASNFAMAAMGGDFTRSMEITNSLQKSWKIDAGDLEKSLDLMARAASVGVNTEDMMTALAKTGLQAQGRGETGFGNLAQMMPYLATILADKTMSGDVVGTNFSKMMSKALTADTAKLKKNFGIDLNFVKDGKFAGLENMVDQLQKLAALDATKQAMAINQLFGDSVELQSIVFKLISEGNRGVKNMEKTMQKFASIQNKVDAANTTLSAKWSAFTGTLDTSLGRLIEPANGMLKTVTDGLNVMAAAVGDFAKEWPRLSAILVDTGLIVGGVTYLIGNFVTTTGMFLMYLPGVIKLWKDTVFWFQFHALVLKEEQLPAMKKNIIAAATWAKELATKLWGGLVAAATASKAFAVKLFTVHIPAVFSAIAAHGLFALAVAGAVVGIAGLVYFITQLADNTTAAGNDLRVLISGFDGLWAVIKKIGGFVIYLATLGNYIPKWASDAEADIDNMASERQIGRYAEVAQTPASSMLSQVGGDTYNLNLEVNNNGKDLDPNSLKRTVMEAVGELKQKEKRDDARTYSKLAFTR